MSNKRPTSVSFARAIHLSFLAVFRPTKFEELERADNEILKASPDAPPVERVLQVRNALLNSFLLVVASASAGLLLGCALRAITGPASSTATAVLQTIGALILLWATLAVRGWDVVTYYSVTYTERVNQWIYRFLYCLGTTIVVWSLAWQPGSGA